MTHRLLRAFTIDYSKLGPSAGIARMAIGQTVISTIMQTEAFSALLGAIEAASSRPPQPALDRYLIPALGPDVAASDEVKILSGRVIRQLIEHVGGWWVRSGVPIIEPSVFANGSIYSLPRRPRGKSMKAADRLAWAHEQADVLRAA